MPFDPVSFISIFRKLKIEKPDIVHLHRINMLSLSAAMSARLLGIPVLASIYDYYYYCPAETLVYKDGKQCLRYHSHECAECMGLKSPKLIKKAILSIRKYIFDCISKNISYHVLSYSSLNILKTYGIAESRIHRIPQFFNMSHVEMRADFKKGMMLYIGWIQERKGLHVLIEAMPDILSAVPCAHLAAVGDMNDDDYADRIKKMIVNKGLSGKITLLGKKEYSDVTAYMHEANVIVIPEQWENMSPVVLIEAMSHGKAVVASNIGGIPEFVTDGTNGFLANRHSPQDFAIRVIRVLVDERKALLIGENAKKHITEMLDSESIMTQYKDVYSKIKGES